MATERLDVNWLPTDPFSGDLVAWKRTGDGWVLYADALDYGDDKKFYPKAARTATTTAEILRLVSAGSAPDTSTLSRPEERGELALTPALALAFIAGLVLGLKRVSRVHRRETRPHEVREPFRDVRRGD